MTFARYKPLMIAVAIVLALLPVLLAPVPGFVDMPSHMARHHVLANIGHDPALAHWFTVRWQWIANLGADLPAVLMTPALGSEKATLLVGALIAPLTVSGMFALSRAAQGRVSASAFVALPLALHQAWMWGFLNYCVGMALALHVAAWIYERPGRAPHDMLLLGGAALAVWTAHMASWVILLVLAAGNELARLRTWRDILPAVLRNLPLLAPVVPLLLWRAQAGGQGAAFSYVDFLDTKLVVFASVLRGTTKIVDLALLAAMLGVSLLALRWAGGRRFEPRLLISGSLLVLAAIAAPTTILNAWGTDLRTAPIALMVLMMAIGPAANPDRERLLAFIGLGLFAVRAGTVTAGWASHGRVLEQRLTMLDAVPRGGKLGYLWVPPSCGYAWRLVPDEKLGSYAVVRRDAFANTLFMVDNAKLMTVRDKGLQARWSGGTQDVPLICPGNRLDRALLQRKLDGLRADGFDAIWVSGVSRSDLPVPAGYRAVRGVGSDTLLVR